MIRVIRVTRDPSKFTIDHASFTVDHVNITDVTVRRFSTTPS